VVAHLEHLLLIILTVCHQTLLPGRQLLTFFKGNS